MRTATPTVIVIKKDLSWPTDRRLNHRERIWTDEIRLESSSLQGPAPENLLFATQDTISELVGTRDINNPKTWKLVEFSEIFWCFEETEIEALTVASCAVVGNCCLLTHFASWSNKKDWKHWKHWESLQILFWAPNCYFPHSTCHTVLKLKTRFLSTWCVGSHTLKAKGGKKFWNLSQARPLFTVMSSVSFWRMSYFSLSLQCINQLLKL